MQVRVLAAAAASLLMAAGAAAADPGQGAQALHNRTDVDFAALSAPSKASMALITNSFETKRPAVAAAERAPVGAGAGTAVPIVHLAGIEPRQLRLSGPVMADIFLGNISFWDAPQIARLNPGVALPHAAISVVHRSDASVTSLEMSQFLESQSRTWRAEVGSGEQVRWMVGTGGQGDAGVAAAVRGQENSIGYVGQAYAAEKGLTSPRIIVFPAITPAKTAPAKPEPPLPAPPAIPTPVLTGAPSPAVAAMIANSGKRGDVKSPAQLGAFTW